MVEPTAPDSRTSARTKRLLVYAHFDPDGVIHGYVIHALRAMRPVCSSVRFVTTSRLAPAEMAKLDSVADERLETANVGFDFSMWKSCLRPGDADEFDEIVLMNSSVYGPFRDAASLFDAMREERCDAWGVTESFEHDRHLQSYFIVLRKSVLVSDAFRTFWNSVLPFPNKRQVIRSYEIGLSQWLEGSGFTLAAFCPWRQLVRYLAANPRRALALQKDLPRGARIWLRTYAFLGRLLHRVFVRPSNPTVAFPEELIELGVPFLKLEVLRDNPFERDVDALGARLRSLGYPAEYLLPARPERSVGGMLATAAPECPICGTAGTVMYSGKSDVLLIGGPAGWRTRKCNRRDCGCAWLDPVPLESEIHKAYASYFTHADRARRVQYVAPRYGPFSRAALRALRGCLDILRLHARRERYWLHGLEGETSRLLEVGCGNGSRLLDLQKLGWTVEGQDVDAQAASYARSRGLHVHEGALERAGLPDATYDVILLSHVLEHVHRPVELLRECRRLLKPGGRLVLSTPNIESLGHFIYGRDWLPLDPPRHLVIHSRRSLRRVLREAGFGETSIRTVPLNCELTALHSRDIKYHGWTDFDSLPRIGRELVPVGLQLAALLIHAIVPGSGEECFAVARAPVANGARPTEAGY